MRSNSKHTRARTVAETPIPDPEGVLFLLREIACQLTLLNETLREMAEGQRSIGEKLDEIRDRQGGGQAGAF